MSLHKKFDRRSKKKETRKRKVLKSPKFLQVSAALIDCVPSFHHMLLVFAELITRCYVQHVVSGSTQDARIRRKFQFM